MVCNFLFYESWVIGVHALGATTKTADAYSSSLAEDCEIILLAHQWESINCHFATVKGLVVTQTALQQLKVTAIGDILMATASLSSSPTQYISAGNWVEIIDPLPVSIRPISLAGDSWPGTNSDT